MVLWEITLATAYFLGLKRTYRLALKIQRRLISPKHPKIGNFARRRTRAVFDVALKVHHNVQHRDIEVGRNVGNWILRCLDRIKPSAQIRVAKPTSSGNTSNSITKQTTESSSHKTPRYYERFNSTNGNRESDRHLFTPPRNVWAKPFPTIMMMMRPTKPPGSNTQYRHFFHQGPAALRLYNERGRFEGVIRKDILQWMQQK